MNKKKGFTLIELLVVIAIIGLLSTLAVVALNQARVKARNAQKISEVKQYMTAFEMMYEKEKAYPSWGAAHTDYRCLGNYADDYCFDVTKNGGKGDIPEGTGTDSINSYVSEFIKALPTGGPAVCSREGYFYGCATWNSTSNRCTKAEINFILEGDTCIMGKKSLTQGITGCVRCIVEFFE